MRARLAVDEPQSHPLRLRVVDGADAQVDHAAVAPNHEPGGRGRGAVVDGRALRAPVRGDPSRELPGAAPVAVHGDDHVTGVQDPRGREALAGLVDTHLTRADLPEEHEQEDRGEHEVDDRTGGDDHDPLPGRLRVVGPGAHLVREALVRVHPRDLHVAARRDRPDRVFGLADLLPREQRREEQREALHPHAHGLGGREVARLVQDHEDDEAEEGQEPAHAATPWTSPRAVSRASASAL